MPNLVGSYPVRTGYLFNGSYEISFRGLGAWGTQLTYATSSNQMLVGGVFQEWPSNAQYLGFALYGANGSLDTTFGSQGFLLFAMPPALANNYNPTTGSNFNFYPTQILMQANKQILIVGNTYSGQSLNGIYSYSTNAVLARFNADGSLDTSFSADGLLSLTELGFTGSSASISHVELSGSQILLAAQGTDSAFNDLGGIYRIDANGWKDYSFSGDGVFTALDAGFLAGANITNFAVRPDGSMLVEINGVINAAPPLYLSYVTGLEHINADGSLDTSYGVNGLFNLASAGGGSRILNLNGSTYVLGSSSIGKLTSAGVLDISFSTDGIVTTTDLNLSNYYVDQIAVQSDGKLVVAAHSNSYPSSSLIERLNADGTIDSTFSPVQFSNNWWQPVQGITILNNGNILLGLQGTNGGLDTMLLGPNGTHLNGQYGVDLNGIDPNPITSYGWGPNQGWLNPFWNAQVALIDGIHAVSISTPFDVSTLPEGVAFNWTSNGMATGLLFGETGTSLPFSFSGVNFTLSTALTVFNNQQAYELKLVSDDPLVNDQIFQDALRSIGLDYVTTDSLGNPISVPANIEQFVLTVQVSHDGVNWQGALPNQDGQTIITVVDVPPEMTGALFYQNHVFVQFDEPNPVPAPGVNPEGPGNNNMPTATNHWMYGQVNTSFFTVLVNGVAVDVKNAVIDSGVMLTLKQSIPADAIVMVYYNAPAVSNASMSGGVVQDWHGNAALSGMAVANYQDPSLISWSNTALAGAILGVDVSAGDQHLGQYSDSNGGPSNGNFVVTAVNGSQITCQSQGDNYYANPSYSALATSGFTSYAFSKNTFSAIVNVNPSYGSVPKVGDVIAKNSILNLVSTVVSLTNSVSVSNDGVTQAASFDLLQQTASTPTPIALLLGIGNADLTWGNGLFTGAVGNDTFTGGVGNDTLIGAAGNDSMDGYDGSDLYVINKQNEHLSAEIHDSGSAKSFAGATIVDEVRFASTTIYETLTLFAGDTGIEKVTIGSGTANAAVSTATTALNVDASRVLNGLTIVGNAGNNYLVGTSFNDVINGGAGADTMVGGNPMYSVMGGVGNDTFVVDNVGDVVIANYSSGVNTVQSSITYSLPGNVQRLVLTGTAAINGTGNDLNNLITGNSADNVLDGGVGSDTLTGGLGNDAYYVDNVGDFISEGVNQGTDTVNASVTYTLQANVENLNLTGMANINGTGNLLANVISGNVGNNILVGAGGNDTLNGGAGNDQYNITQGQIGNIVISDTSGADVIKWNFGFDKTYLGGSIVEVTRTGTNNANLYLTTYLNNVQVQTVTVNNQYPITLGASIETVTYADGTTPKTFIDGLTASGADQIVVASATASTLVGSGGRDLLFGGAGNDALTSTAGDKNNLWGGAGVDTMTAGAIGLETTINDLGNGGSDVFIVNTGATGKANVYYSGWSATAGTLNNGTANIYTNGYAVNLAVINTGNGFGVNNVSARGTLITGSGLNDTLIGGLGNDTFVGGLGNDSVVGGGGNDTVTYAAASAAVNVNLLTGSVSGGAGLDTLSGISTVIGSAYNDILTGNDSLISGMVNDFLIGAAGLDTISGGLGNNTLSGGVGADTFIVMGSDSITDLGVGQDVLTVSLGGVANATIAAGWTATVGTVNNGTANLLSAGFNVNLAQVTTGTVGFTVKDATATAVTFNGSALNDTLIGNGLNDILVGGLGDDVLTGGVGIDTFTVTSGTDSITDLGLGGSDVLTVAALSIANATIGAAWVAGATSVNNGTENITTAGFGVNLTAATGTGLFNVTNIGGVGTTLIGSAGADNITGSSMIHDLNALKNIPASAQGGFSGLGLLGTYLLNGPSQVSSCAVCSPTQLDITYLDGTHVVMNGTNLCQQIFTPGIPSYTVNMNDFTLTLADGEVYSYVGNWSTVINIDPTTNLISGYGASTGSFSSVSWTDGVWGVSSKGALYLDNSGQLTTEFKVSNTVAGVTSTITLTGTAAITNTLDVNGFITSQTPSGNLTSMVANDGMGNVSTWTGSISFAAALADIQLSGGTKTIFDEIPLNLVLGTNDTLAGGAGNDTLAGGLGNNLLTGGLGIDTFNVTGTDNVTDLGTGGAEVLTVASGGIANATISAAWTAGIGSFNYGTANLTSAGFALTLSNVITGLNGFKVTNTSATGTTFKGSNFADSLVGNSGSDILVGGGGNDTLVGAAGNNSHTGGAGADTFVVKGLDNIIDLGTGGQDVLNVALAATAYANIGQAWVATSATSNYGAVTLTSNGLNVNLGLVTVGANGFNVVNSSTTSVGIIFTGSSFADTLIGAGGADTLIGGGGVDSMNGGEGADIFVISTLADHAAAEIHDTGLVGVDEVRFAATAASTLTLYAGDTGIDKVVIGTGTAAAAVTTAATALNVNAASVLNALSMNGNAGNNQLIGTAYSDTLIGGNGNDILTGGAGVDSFVFNFATNGTTNKDTITDFVSNSDILQFSKAIFAGVAEVGGAGTGTTIATSEFLFGAGTVAATNATQHFIYNTTSGILYYDSDGTGATAAVAVAVLGALTHPGLAYTDIHIIA